MLFKCLIFGFLMCLLQKGSSLKQSTVSGWDLIHGIDGIHYYRIEFS